MSSVSEFLKLVKQIAVEAVEQTKPVKFMFGRVESVHPLRIRRDAKTVLSGVMLIQTERVSRRISVGDRVVLIRQQGGQRYLVLDRVV